MDDPQSHTGKCLIFPAIFRDHCPAINCPTGCPIEDGPFSITHRTKVLDRTMKELGMEIEEPKLERKSVPAMQIRDRLVQEDPWRYNGLDERQERGKHRR